MTIGIFQGPRWRGLQICLYCIALLIALPSASADDDHHDQAESLSERELTEDEPYFSHVHGLGFLPESDTVMLAAHDGLWFFESGAWTHSGTGAHDFMGFAPIRDGFYASGHPDLTSDLPNPLGLVKVSEEGAPLELISFQGDIDFHILAADRSGQRIYVFNESPSDQLTVGLHVSSDGGKRWRRFRGFPDDDHPTQIAAHPTRNRTMAALIGASVFLTTNSGRSFEPISAFEGATAIAFHPDGVHMLAGGTGLFQYELRQGTINRIAVPASVDDGHDRIIYIAVNPMDHEQIVVLTDARSVRMTTNRGGTWREIYSSNHSEAEEEDQGCDCE